MGCVGHWSIPASGRFARFERALGGQPVEPVESRRGAAGYGESGCGESDRSGPPLESGRSTCCQSDGGLGDAIVTWSLIRLWDTHLRRNASALPYVSARAAVTRLRRHEVARPV